MLWCMVRKDRDLDQGRHALHLLHTLGSWQSRMLALTLLFASTCFSRQ